jgi:putative YphP/YqiW family bacilliredoxin
MYPEIMVIPMREELSRLGIEELRTAEEVERELTKRLGTTMVVVNSVCGCAAGKARPAIAKALRHSARPEVLTTVFAGQDPEATAQARSYFTNYAPSSPSVALMRDGKVVYMLERRDIESRDPGSIADELTAAFDRFCTPTTTQTAQ